ncbi:helix-turn-helix domain-containing protein [Phyllobacterium sp. TAF24]|uniref:helix-turn-helix domain-containing protein n=1 Tax=Phyllobacterium sp. TAF24 TaxID=3233068 RepID=UPI003F9A4F87
MHTNKRSLVTNHLKSKDIAQRFSERLKMARHQRGLTLSRLAQLAGISLASVEYYHSGTHRPSLELFISLCLTLEISPNELLDWDDHV